MYTPCSGRSTSTFIIFNCKQTLWQQQANFLLLFQQNGISLKSKRSRCIAHMTHTHTYIQTRARTHLRSYNRMSKSFWFRMARSLQSLVLSSASLSLHYCPPLFSLVLCLLFCLCQFLDADVWWMANVKFICSEFRRHKNALLSSILQLGCMSVGVHTDIRCLSIWTTSKHFALFLFSYRSHLHKTLKAF